MTGVCWYLGMPAAGKTTLAATHAADLCAQTGWPVLCIDSTDAKQLDHIPQVHSVAAAVDRVFRQRQHAAINPSSDEDFEALMVAVYERKRVIVLIDETAFWVTAQKGKTSYMLRLCRGHRHAQVWMLLTTQHFTGDVPAAAISCAPTLYVFANDSELVLDKLEREYAMPADLVRNLPQGHFLRRTSGFTSGPPRS